MTSSVSLPELGAAQRESRLRVGGRGGGNGRDAAKACGGIDFRPSEPSGKGAAVLNSAQREREHGQTSPCPGSAHALLCSLRLRCAGLVAALGGLAPLGREAGLRCAQPRLRLLAPAAPKVADLAAFDPPGAATVQVGSSAGGLPGDRSQDHLPGRRPDALQVRHDVGKGSC